MKKEPLSIITIKTLLAVIIFTGVGTIIIGGGLLIGMDGKVSNNRLPKPVIEKKQKEKLDIKTGNAEIDNDINVKALQKNVDEGHQPWRLNPDMVLLTIKSYGFTDEDLNNVDFEGAYYEPGKKIYQIQHKANFYLITLTQPVIGENKIWIISKIEINKNEIADWQIYQNKKYGFELKYPKNWDSRTLKDDIFVIQCEHGFCDFHFTVYSNSENLSIDEFYKDRFTLYDLLRIENILLGENKIPAPKLILKTKEAATPDSKVIIAIKKGEYIIEIEDVYGRSLDPNFEEFNQILSSFKFIKIDEAADWKTYRNKKYGFEFDYPEGWEIKSRKLKTEKTISVTSHNNPEKYFLEKWLDVYRGASPVEAGLSWREEFSLAGEKAFKGGFGCCMNYVQTVFFAREDKIYQISGGMLDFNVKPIGSYYNYQDEFNQLLSSFKFIEK